ncbi:GlcG/HbpS family heme-binding protein [Streptomyces sp. enrichment culture]|uniref:GlcG/HbpS family heme-binding protein n=1 Tax=Streptomyces sp. enrichment culture TaxID=1795815 RepID=UPI003F55A673
MITLSAAERAVQAGKDKAAELGVPFTVTVVDAGAHLIAAARMDGAALAAVETSRSKARTAVLFARATRDLAPEVQPGAPLFGIEAGTRDPLAFVAGGVPVVRGGVVVGAIGVGGGTPDEDHEVAAAALTVL